MLSLDNSFFSSQGRVRALSQNTDKGIKFYKNKPNRLSRLFRKSIQAKAGPKNEIVYLNTRSAKNYIKRHGIILKKGSQVEVVTALTTIFNKEKKLPTQKPEPIITKTQQIPVKPIEDQAPKAEKLLDSPSLNSSETIPLVKPPISLNPAEAKTIRYESFIAPILSQIFPKDFPWNNDKVTFLLPHYHSRTDDYDTHCRIESFEEVKGKIDTPFFITIIVHAPACACDYESVNKVINKQTGKTSLYNNLFDPLTVTFKADMEITAIDPSLSLLKEKINKIDKMMKSLDVQNLTDDQFKAEFNKALA